jgi:hypothetical protein
MCELLTERPPSRANSTPTPATQIAFYLCVCTMFDHFDGREYRPGRGPCCTGINCWMSTPTVYIRDNIRTIWISSRPMPTTASHLCRKRTSRQSCRPGYAIDPEQCMCIDVESAQGPVRCTSIPTSSVERGDVSETSTSSDHRINGCGMRS